MLLKQLHNPSKMNSIFASLVLSLVILVVSGSPLYSPTDRIVLLENDTIITTLYHSPVAWFVEFYSSWCGHCQSFAPSWKRLGKQVEGWSNVVRIAAIDCAEARNLGTCESFSIQGYPSLKFFKAFTTNTSDVGSVYEGKRSTRKMRHAIIDFLEVEDHHENHLDFKSLSNKFSNEFVKSSSKHIVLVFEKRSSYLGKELTLDLMNNRKISVKRVVDDKVEQKKYKVTKLPKVILLLKDETVYLLNKSREGILAELESFHVERKTPPTPKAIKATNSHFKELHKNDVSNLKQGNISMVYMQDLESALSFIFRREIVIKKFINKKQLKGFVDLLVQCFPGRPPVNNFLKLLQVWLSERSRPITPAAIRLFYAMHQADPECHLPDEIYWQSCQGSMPQYRGYPCSLWELFHTLTVNCANLNVTQFSGADVLARIRGFVTTFFSCLECARHFSAMSKNVENEVHSHDEAILWLWKAHNKVNKRLNKEPSTDPQFPKIQYPPRDLCHDCSDDDDDISTSHRRKHDDQISMPHWRKNVLLQFLKVHYGLNNIRLTTEKNEIESDEKDLSESVRLSYGRNFVSSISYTMDQFDTSLCVAVYGAGIVILALLYIYILKRRRRSFKHQSHMA